MDTEWEGWKIKKTLRVHRWTVWILLWYSEMQNQSQKDRNICPSFWFYSRGTPSVCSGIFYTNCIQEYYVNSVVVLFYSLRVAVSRARIYLRNLLNFNTYTVTWFMIVVIKHFFDHLYLQHFLQNSKCTLHLSCSLVAQKEDNTREMNTSTNGYPKFF